MSGLMGAETRVWLTMAWAFCTLGGAFVSAAALLSGLADQPLALSGWWLALGIVLLVAGIGSAVALLRGSRTESGRAFAVGAIVVSLTLVCGALPPLLGF